MKKLSFTLGLFLVINVTTKAQICFDSTRVFKPIGRASTSITSADFNRDGKADLASTNNYVKGSNSISNVSVLLGTGVGNFTALADTFDVDYGTAQIINADFNNDGKVDLATVNSVDVSILLGTGTGHFSNATNFLSGISPRSITSSDFNGDGFADFATANPGTKKVWVSLGTGTGNFNTAQSFTVGGYPMSVISADFNGDGKTDLATANGDSNNVSILLGTGNGSFGTATSFTAGVWAWWKDTIYMNVSGGVANSLISADFNGDGKLDLAVSHNDSNIVSILLGNGAGSFSAATNFTVDPLGSPYQMISADFNGDGKADLATANPYSFIMPSLYMVTNTISVLLGDGTGSLGTANIFTVGSGPYGIINSDFNGDGKIDLAAIDTAVSVLLSCDVLGIEHIKNSNELHIFPNPSTGIMYVELGNKNDVKNGNYQMQITNILGETILQVNSQQNNNATIDLSAQPNGVYFISLQTDGKQYTQKVIKN